MKMKEQYLVSISIAIVVFRLISLVCFYVIPIEVDPSSFGVVTNAVIMTWFALHYLLFGILHFVFGVMLARSSTFFGRVMSVLSYVAGAIWLAEIAFTIGQSPTYT
jgi:hypothetical protein